MSRVAGIKILIALLAVAGYHAGSAWAQEPPRMHRDTICGPRCVQMILGQYGIEADLIELVKETQWPEVEKGASLAALEKALQRRQLFTTALRMPPDAELRWKHPVLLHIAGKEDPGHYVVWIPARADRKAVVWDWLKGTHDWNQDVASTLSGYVLLTAPEPINRPQDAVRIRSRVNLVVVAAGGLLMTLAAAIMITGVLRRRRDNAVGTVPQQN